MHDVYTIGLPILVILVGILLNQQSNRDLKAEINGLRGEIGGVRGEVNGLRAEMNARFSYTDSRIDRIQADLAQFYRSLGEHDARIAAVEGKTK